MIILNLDPVAFSIGPLSVRWYGIAYALGLICGYSIAKRLNKINNALTTERLDSLLIYMMIAIICGGRLGYVLFYHPDMLMSDILGIFRIWEGGMSFHGAFMAMILAIYIFTQKHRLHFFSVSDLIVCAVPIGILFGRIANFINGELYGRVTNVMWGVVFSSGGHLSRHPSQLYEAVGEGLLNAILLPLIYIGACTNNKRRGLCSGLFMLNYSIVRMIVEEFRDYDYGYTVTISHHIFSEGQILCIPMFIGSIVLIASAVKYK